jgi:MFS transporter, MHS family, dicarboxylic acid transporter PcaT
MHPTSERAEKIDGVTTLNHRERIRSIAGACAGNLVEWFDFFAYAYTSIYFAGAFFPKGEKIGQLLAAAGVFAVGFLMRPIGGWFFGRLADRRGRKHSLMISIFMMCGGSLMIAVLPTHAQIGVAAPVLLLVARLVQGLSVGGEYASTATYLSEIATPQKRGFYGSFQYVTIIAGQLLVMVLLVFLHAILPLSALESWGWRIPFAVGALAGLAVARLRWSMRETGSTQIMQSKEAGSLTTLLRYKRSLVLGFAISAGGSVYFYIFTSYMQKLLVATGHFTAHSVSRLMALALLIFMLIQPACGSLADRIGLKANVLITTGVGAATAVPILTALSSVRRAPAAFLLVLTGLVIISFYNSIGGIVKADLFPPQVRALGVGLAHSTAVAVFGGSTEYLALLMKLKGVEQYFFYYAAAMVGTSFIAALLLPDLRLKGFLDGSGEMK